MGQVYFLRVFTVKSKIGWTARLLDGRGVTRFKVWRPTRNWAANAAESLRHDYVHRG
jgi:hypothetical protein